MKTRKGGTVRLGNRGVCVRRKGKGRKGRVKVSKGEVRERKERKVCVIEGMRREGKQVCAGELYEKWSPKEEGYS